MVSGESGAFDSGNGNYVGGYRGQKNRDVGEGFVGTRLSSTKHKRLNKRIDPPHT